jgi:hypothetical protein
MLIPDEYVLKLQKMSHMDFSACRQVPPQASPSRVILLNISQGNTTKYFATEGNTTKYFATAGHSRSSDRQDGSRGYRRAPSAGSSKLLQRVSFYLDPPVHNPCILHERNKIWKHFLPTGNQVLIRKKPIVDWPRPRALNLID